MATGRRDGNEMAMFEMELRFDMSSALSRCVCSAAPSMCAAFRVMQSSFHALRPSQRNLLGALTTFRHKSESSLILLSSAYSLLL